MRRYTKGAQAKARRQLWHGVLSGQPFQQSMLPAFNKMVESTLDDWTEGEGDAQARCQEDVFFIWVTAIDRHLRSTLHVEDCAAFQQNHACREKAW